MTPALLLTIEAGRILVREFRDPTNKLKYECACGYIEWRPALDSNKEKQ